MINAPEGVKQAIHMGANEAFCEWIDRAADDPEGALDSLGATYQEAMTPDALTEDEARRLVADLAAWDDGTVDTSHAARSHRFERLMCKAGIEFAHALIAEATGTGEVPDRVKPYLGELAPMVAELKKAIAAGGYDESAYDITAAIFG